MYQLIQALHQVKKSHEKIVKKQILFFTYFRSFYTVDIGNKVAFLPLSTLMMSILEWLFKFYVLDKFFFVENRKIYSSNLLLYPIIEYYQSTCRVFAEFLQRLNFGGTKFVSADTFCRKIFRLRGIYGVLENQAHNHLLFSLDTTSKIRHQKKNSIKIV
uniref:Uncharacterized protein n=1 Tax=Brachionus plicatilis TaxID=10195 RepID=A0A3M7QGD3_BRAPC|nr:hypothetical protein BpHYR1_033922 [Brachionus plicatilis]